MMNFIDLLVKSLFIRKKIENKVLNRTISDMETDGMYFTTEIKEKIKTREDELHCEYSGLPSVMSYMENP